MFNKKEFENQKPEAISLRAMALEDVKAVYAIESSSQPVPWSEGIFRDCLLAGYDGWVLQLNGAIVGYVLTYVRSRECHILNICIKTALRGRGYAQLLLRHALQHANTQNADTTFLEVRPSNTPALHVYRKFGFNEIGVRKDYYANPDGSREDALVFALDMSVQG